MRSTEGSAGQRSGSVASSARSTRALARERRRSGVSDTRSRREVATTSSGTRIQSALGACRVSCDSSSSCSHCLAFVQAAGAGPPELSERERASIEALIASVEQLREAHSVRNGEEYSESDAARFLRKKWKSREADVHSAEEFIDQVGSFFTKTKKPYLIRYADGHFQTTYSASASS